MLTLKGIPDHDNEPYLAHYGENCALLSQNWLKVFMTPPEEDMKRIAAMAENDINYKIWSAHDEKRSTWSYVVGQIPPPGAMVTSQPGLSKEAAIAVVQGFIEEMRKKYST